PVIALALTPVLWLLGLTEVLGAGAGLDDPGGRQALSDWADDLREWWRTTKQSLREAGKGQPGSGQERDGRPADNQPGNDQGWSGRPGPRDGPADR
ncbi:MAG: hypothetical protein SYR96_01035, partial [Actinomycetota bacterium]|nr:hypothetical protein [Actinomycetota bacterium]